MDPPLPRGSHAPLRLNVSALGSKKSDDESKRRDPPEPPRFRLVTVRGVRPHPGVELDRPRELEVQDDEAQFRRFPGIRWQHPLGPDGI